MSAYRNVTFDEIEVGATASAQRAADARPRSRRWCSCRATSSRSSWRRPARPRSACWRWMPSASSAVISGLLERKLPGPGTRIVSHAPRLRGHGQRRRRARGLGDGAREAAGHGLRGVRLRRARRRRVACCGARAVVEAPRRRLAYSDIATPEIILRRNDVFARLLRDCEPLEPVRCAVAHPCDRDSLLGALEAARRGLIVPVLVGPPARIRAVAEANGADISGFRHRRHRAQPRIGRGRRGAGARRRGRDADEGQPAHRRVAGQIVASTAGLRTERRISHVFVMDVPAYDRVLLVTDAAINIEPTLDEKADIVQNAIDLAHVLGIADAQGGDPLGGRDGQPRTSARRSTPRRCARWPIAARSRAASSTGRSRSTTPISEHAARTKGIRSPVAGRADILMVPNIESGNMLAKQLQYFAGADSAGVVLGARVPMVLTSRARQRAHAHRLGGGRQAAGAHAKRRARRQGAVMSAGGRRHRRPQRRLLEHQVLHVPARGAELERELRARCRGSARRRGFARSDATRSGRRRALAARRRSTTRPRSSLLLDFARSGAARRGASRRRPSRRARRSRVHGADARRRATVLARLARYVPLAPLHQPHNLAAIRVLLERLPGVPQVACFDTAFHRTMPEVAQLFALPPRFAAAGRAPLRLPRAVVRVRRLACCRRSTRGPRRAHGRVPPRQRRQHVRARRRAQRRHHHGVHRGRRPADGHAQRAARPRRAAVHDRRARASGAREIERLLYTESGLLGMSGVSSDMRDLLASDEPRARLALDVFVLPGAARAGLAGGGARRPRCDRVHRGHRREPARGAAPHLRATRVARRRARRGRPTIATGRASARRAAGCRRGSCRPTRKRMIARHVARLLR